MSAVADLHLAERPALAARLRSALAHVARNRAMLLGTATAGLLLTFAAMLARLTHDPLTLALCLAPLVGVGVAAGRPLAARHAALRGLDEGDHRRCDGFCGVSR